MAEPRCVTREEAAAYVRVSPSTFDGLVRAGTMPPALDLGGGRSRRWDRKAIDAALDQLSGIPSELRGELSPLQAWKARRRQDGRSAA